ncbi:MAG: FkbM family methyltransferase [Candidatus Obscuribacterales bacterium]|nr:FkbM family methyltransferase [Candidatus Obscuribacterales bacterium]
MRKLSAHALNFSGAGRLSCRESGEQIALNYVLSKRSNKDKIVIFDVGANIGQYASMCVDKLSTTNTEFEIFSFEPTSAASESLKQSLQSESRVRIFQLGLGDKPGEQLIYMPWQTCTGASAHPGFVEFWPHKISGELIEERVSIDTVDNLMEKYSLTDIHLLKIDVEGAEFNVIEGARKTLQQQKIKFIQFEISPATLLNKSCLYDFWRELSPLYKFFLVMNQGLVEIKTYSGYLENAVGASNFLCELR